MEEREMRDLLASVAAGTTSPDEAALRLKTAPYTDMGYAKVDNHRGIRQGAAEVIYGEDKTPEHIAGIASAMRANGQKRVIITRLPADVAAQVETLMAANEMAPVDSSRGETPGEGGVDVHVSSVSPFTYHVCARLGVVGDMPQPDGNGAIVIAAAGTSDLSVAEEAAVTAEALGNAVTRLYDVGVAGMHRLLAHADDIARAQVIIAVAGMEGALASVVGGMASCPVIAVPTSVGYGASFGGVAALLAMLNSCASGVSVVNIDNGFGAAYQASTINHLRQNFIK